MKQKIKNFLKIGILSLGISILIISCSKNEVVEVEQTEIQLLQKEFTLENFENTYVKNNLEIDWNGFQISNENSSLSTYEFSTNLKSSNFIENDNNKLFFKYKLKAFKTTGNNWNFEIIKFLTDDEKSLEKISCFSSNDFSGTMLLFDLNGKLIDIKGIEKGNEIKPFKDKNILTKSIPIPTDSSPINSGGGSFTWIEIIHYTDWYKVYNGSQAYTHSVYNYTTWEYVYVPYDNNYSTSSPYHNHYSNGGL